MSKVFCNNLYWNVEKILEHFTSFHNDDDDDNDDDDELFLWYG